MSTRKFRNIFTTSFALGLGQILNFLLIPFIARLYAPEVFSQWALYLTVVTILGGISTARYSDSLVLLKTKKNFETMLLLCIYVGAFFFGIGVLICGALWGIGYLKTVSAVLAPLNIFVWCLHLCILQILVRNNHFSLYAISIFTMSVFPGVLQVITGYGVASSSNVIVTSGFLGQVLSVLVSIVYSGLRLKGYPLRKLRAIARRYSQFPKYSLGFAFFSLLRIRALYFIFGAFKNTALLGNYAQTERLLNAPSALLGASVRPVFFRYAAEVGIEKIDAVLRSFLRLILFLNAPLIGILIFFAEDIITIVLGASWSESVWMFKLLIIPSFFLFSTNWLDRAFDILKAQKLVFLLECCYGALSIVLCAYTLLVLGKPFWAVCSLSIIFSFYYGHWLVLLFSRIGSGTFSVISYLLVSLGLIAASFVLLHLARSWGLGAIWSLILLLVFFIPAIMFGLRKDFRALLNLLSFKVGGDSYGK